MWVAFSGFFPIKEDSLGFVAVPTDLKGKIGVGMPIIGITPFVFLVELDEVFFVEPGLGIHFGVRLVIALKSDPLFLSFVGGVFLVILHEKGHDLKGLVFHPLDVKVYFSANLMF